MEGEQLGGRGVGAWRWGRRRQRRRRRGGRRRGGRPRRDRGGGGGRGGWDTCVGAGGRGWRRARGGREGGGGGGWDSRPRICPPRTARSAEGGRGGGRGAESPFKKSNPFHSAPAVGMFAPLALHVPPSLSPFPASFLFLAFIHPFSARVGRGRVAGRWRRAGWAVHGVGGAQEGREGVERRAVR